jgi:predicted transcriptional regulator
MKRTTISLPDELAAALEQEARRRRTSVWEIAREAIEARLSRTSSGRRRLPFAALGRSGRTNTARDIQDLIQSEWATDSHR